jgi:hypothetical protein
LECVQKIVWPFTLTKFDALNASLTSTRHITTGATTWIWFFGFLDDSGQIYRNGFAWSSVARTQNILETATPSLIEYVTRAIKATISAIVFVIACSHH